MYFDIYILTTLLFFILILFFDIYFITRHIYRYVKTRTKFKIKLKYFISKFVLLNFFFTLISLSLGYLIYSRTTPQIIYSTPQTETAWESYDKPIEVVFNVPVDSSRLNPNMNPMIKGRWEWEPFLGINRLTKAGKFYPEESLFPNERIVIYITGIGRIGNRNDNHEGGIVLQSVSLPEVKATYPFHKATNIETNDSIGILFSKPVDDLADVKFTLEPEDTELEVEKVSPTLYTLVPKIKLQQSTEYTLKIERIPKKINLNTKEVIEKDNPSIIHKLKFTTVKEPFIKSISPKGSGTKPDSSIRFRFEVDMNRESVESNIKIEPEIPGEFIWHDNRTLVLQPKEPLTKATKYKISINSGLKSIYGGVSDKSLEHEFETIGKIKIEQTSPENGAVRVNINSNITITFDQEVDKVSAQEKLVISPSISGTFRWEGKKMIFDPSSLAFGTTYTLTINPGIKSLYGIDNDQTTSITFTTRGQEVIISMPWYPQPQSPVSFTCNIVSAQMALAWKGYNTSATGLISEIGYNSGYANGNWTGNPYKEFVGCPDGYCGYGVYWTALQKLFVNRGISTEIKSGWNISELARSIENGHPVIIWRYNGTSANGDRDWVASDGTYIDAINGQHGGVVTGYRGTIENPSAFYINDPWFGLIWMDRNTFDYYWSRLNRSALIIY